MKRLATFRPAPHKNPSYKTMETTVNKRILMALACSTAGLASAQTVTIFGVADAMVGSYKTAGAPSVTKLNSGGLAASRLGFRGVEDLGSGYSASFWLEAQYAVDTGTGSTTNTNNQPSGITPASSGLTFNRRSTVSVSGPFGETRLGRDYVPAFWNFAFYDPFNMFGVASASNLNFAGTSGPAVNTVRNSNSIGYLYNSRSFTNRQGWYGQVQYALGESSTSDGTSYGALVGFAGGPWNGSIAYMKTKLAAVQDYTLASLGGSWDFGVVKAMLEYSVANSGMPQTKYTTTLLGAQIPVGLAYIPISYTTSRRNNATGASAKQYGLGYVYNLSVRTAVYANYAQISNSNGAAFAVGSGAGVPGAPNAKSTGLEMGMKHSF